MVPRGYPTQCLREEPEELICNELVTLPWLGLACLIILTQMRGERPCPVHFIDEATIVNIIIFIVFIF